MRRTHPVTTHAKKKCIVTGGAGFIGSHLTERLIADGHEVIVLDNFSMGKSNDLAHLADSPGFSLTKADVADLENICPLFQDIDWVFHLAAMADIVPSIENPIIYHRANVDGTVSVLEAARREAAPSIASRRCHHQFLQMTSLQP